MTRPLLLLLTTLVLSACGGGAGTSSSTGNSGGNNSSGGTDSPDTPVEEPQTPIGYTVIDFNFEQKSNNRQYRSNQVQTAQFSNATGAFLLPLVNQDLTGNITIGVEVSDPDGLSGIKVGFTGSDQAIELCAQNCGVNYSRVITGVSPVDFDLTSGDQRLELWVNDTAGNQVQVNTVEFDWQNTPITGISALRNNNTIDLSWNRLSNYLRYNVYVASEPGVTPDNFQSLADGQAYYALSNPNIALTGKEDTRTFYTTVTGIDGSGESAFGELIQVLAVEGAIDLPPTAQNDMFSVDEDQTLTGNLIANDSDLESETVTINTQPITQPENGTVTINPDGTFSYQPKEDFNGRDAFAYQISDGVGATDQAYAIITVNQTNDAPTPSFNNYNVLTESRGYVIGQSSANQSSINNGILTVNSPGVMSNDLDIDGSSLTLDTTPVVAPTKGELTLNADGSFTYTVAQGQSGEDSFTYRTIDSEGASNEAVVTISINGENFPPRAANDIYQLEENQTFNTDGSSSSRLSVLANDSDEDGDTLTVATNIVTEVKRGTLNLDATGNFTYIPEPGFYGIDFFIYQVTDSQGNVAQAAGILYVTKKNASPIAEPDSYMGQEDTTLTISATDGVLSNDFDQDFDNLSVSSQLVAEPANGTVSISANGSFDYVPNDNFFGTDTFSYSVNDGQGDSATGTVTISIANINDAPVANDDAASTTVNTEITISVLANDTDIEQDTLVITQALIDEAQGSAVIDNDASIVYIPASGFEGFAEITYTISDGNGGSDTGTVNVAVNVANSAPIAVNDSYSMDEDTVLNANGNQAPTLIANDTDADGDSLTVLSAALNDPTQGFLNVNPTGRFTYRPNDNFFGQVVFSYEISDGKGGTDTGVATIEVASVNDLPVAQNDQTSTAEETLININPLANDSDEDGDALTISAATAQNGQVQILADNTINYTPTLNFVGFDEIAYQINDGNQGTDSATIFVNVINVNDAPNAVDDTANTEQNTQVTINVLANDSDIDGDSLEIVAASASNGAVQITNNQQISYTPNNGFSGSDTINYTIGDGNGGTDSANVFVSVAGNPNNQPPVANDDFATFDEDTTLTLNVLGNDTDPDGDTLELINATTDTTIDEGTLSFNASGDITYTPANNFNGQISIAYTISDGNDTDSANLNLTIVAVNDAPTALNDTASVNKNGFVGINVLANDSDIDGDTLTLISATASFGNAIINSDQTIVYQPNTDFVGNDTITYIIEDAGRLTATAQVTVNVIDNSASTLTANNDFFTVVGYEATNLNPLSNDSDSSGSAITLVSVIAQQGQVSIVQNSLVSYQAPSGFVGTDEVLYIITNQAGDNATATMFVTVQSGENQAPVANPDTANTDEDQAVTINALANDNDPDGDVLRIVSASANKGTITLTNNQILYTPNANFNGQDTINYTIQDTSAATASSTVSVTVNAVNDGPIALNDQATTDEDSSVSIAVLANDSDIDGDTLTITGANAENGTVVINQDGSLTYTGKQDFNGTDTINYTIVDSLQAQAQAAVNVTINPVNDAPVANPDIVQAQEDKAVVIAVLSNDTDVDGDNLTVTAATAEKGTVTILEDQTLSYQPEANFSGEALIQYTISDGVLSASSIATVTTEAVNDAPIANPDIATTKEDEAVTVDAIANDTDSDSETLTIEAVTATNGEALIVENKIQYTPKANFNGEEVINYTINDGDGGKAQSTVTVTITPVNDLPIAQNDAITINEDFTTTIDVLANDSDVDGDTLTITIDQTSSGGSQVTSDNKITYTPEANKFGEAQIVYIINDGNGGTASAVVNITIEAVNDAPIAVNDVALTQEDLDVLIDVVANDTDIEGDTLTVSIQAAQNGIAVIENNQVRFTPTANYNGDTTVTYLLSDSAGGTDQGLINITVIAVNDPPIAQNDQATVNEDSSVSIDILANDSDVDNDTLTILAANSANGSVTIENNALTYSPSTNFNGSDTIDYLIADSQGVTAGAQVAITVNASNDAPIAINDQYTISEDVVSDLNILANDSDIDAGDTLNIVVATATSGTVNVTTNNDVQQLTYTPEANFNGTATISYTISDNNCITIDSCSADRYAQAQATLTINPVNDTPVATDASVQIAENVANGYSVHTVAATDVDQDTLTYAISSGNIDSVFAIDNQSGEITVVNKSGLSFNTRPQYILVVQISDTQLASAFAQVTIDLTKASGNQTLVTDTSFGNYNIPGVSIANAYSFDNKDTAGAGTIDSQDRAIIAGSVTNTKSDIVVTRYLADGSLDHSFGQQGVLTHSDSSTFQNIKAAITDSSNNIYLVGESFNDSNSEVDILLAKVTSAGQFDNSFGSSGIQTTNLSQSNVQVNDLVMHSNGSIYVAATLNSQFAIFEFNATNGSLSQSNPIDVAGDFEIAMAIKEQSDGKLLVAGHSADSSKDFNYDFTIIRVDQSSLTLDTSYATNGQARFDVNGSNDDFVHDMLIAPNGDAVLVGATSYGNNIYDVALVQIDSNGAPNTNIGNQGILIFDADGDGQNLTGSSKAMDVKLNNGELYLGIEVQSTSSEPQVGAIKIASGGVLDSSFGTSGISTINLKSGQESIAGLMFNNSNQLLMAASAQGTRDQDFVLARLTSAGAIDDSFNQNGSNFTNLTPSNDQLTNGIELAHGNYAGKIVMVGSSNSNTTVSDAVVARYTSAGNLDTSFGNDGYWRITNNNTNAYEANSVAQLTDGRLVVGGNNGEDAFIALLTEQGQLDTSFDSDGIKILSPSDSNLTQSIEAVGIHNNQIIFAGNSRDISNDMHDIYIGKVNVNGSLDTSYGSSGVLASNLGQNEIINNMTVLSDGAIVVVGMQSANTDNIDSRALVVKFSASGALDSSFNSRGYLALDADSTVNDNQDELFDIEVNSSGILYASGSSRSTTTNAQLVLSVNANGSLNSQFDSDGIVLHDFGTSSESPSLTLDSNQKPLLTGIASNTTDGGSDVFIVRLSTDGQVDPLFNNGNPYVTSYGFSDDVSVILATGSTGVLIAGDFPVSQLNASAWYMHKLTLSEN